MKRQQRFSSRESIIATIERTHATMRDRSIRADEYEDLNKAAYQTMAKLKPSDSRYLSLLRETEEHKLECSKLRRKNNGTLKRLDRLKRTLAAFDTKTMPGFPGDAVVLQP